MPRLRPARFATAAAAAAMVLLAVTAVAELAGVRAGAAADGRDWLIAALCAPLGARIAAQESRNLCGWLILAIGVLAAATVGTSLAADGSAAWARGWLWWPGYGLLVLVAFVFPNGHAVSRFWRAVAVALAVSVGAGTVALASLAWRAPGLLAGDGRVAAGWDLVLFLGATGALVVGGVLAVPAVVLRIRRSPSRARGPLWWAVVNTALLIVAMVLDAIVDVPLAWLAGALAIPVVAVVGVVRYGLYDVGLLVHRSLLYGTLTVAAVAIYGTVVGLAASLAPDAVAPVAVATTSVALLPLRQGLQAVLERRLYGLRSRPYELVSRIGRRAGTAETPEQILTAAVGSLGDGLRVPYAAVRLHGGDAPEAIFGSRRSWPVTSLPLTRHGEIVGRLDVQQRGPDEPWSERERDLLDDLGAQFGPMVASVLLARDLRDARGNLAHAREEEARRLQRDLHDGIGPALSGARMLVRALRPPSGDTAVLTTLEQVEQGLAGAAAEVRRIVANLRPAALDRGLAPALDTATARHRCALLDVRLTVVGELAGLPAAVEVATYRVVDEALTNIGRHAGATSAAVTVTREPARLLVEIADDGRGGAADRPGGVGLGSMRQRCRELGGALRIAERCPGTLVTASFPLG